MPKLGRWPLLAVVALLLAGVYQYMASIESIKNVFPFLSLGMVPGYAVDEVPNLTGKTAIVTGANSGLGKESAYELLRKGAHVVLACRSVERGEQAVQDLKLRDAKPDDVVSAAEWKFDVMALDVGSPYSIRAFVRGFNGRRSAAMVAADAGRESDAPPLHILLLNAGVFHVPYRLTDFQVESHFAVNHVGNQMLTQMLRPNLDRAVAGASGGVATVTVVSSATVYAADTVSLSIDDLNGEDGYSAALRYAESKLASALFTKRLARIWKDRSILVNLARPGAVHTEITKHLPIPFVDWVMKLGPLFGIQWLARDAVVTQLRAATSPELLERRQTGANFIPLAIEWPYPKAACNETLQDLLWDFTEDIIEASARKQA
eukprot:INCI17912.1.p1 GENE.INCI17912.1~~INCI17912.1.p1  ORF type:complete len:376 (-),score=65.20 INCI17912.1:801-1928(-)